MNRSRGAPYDPGCHALRRVSLRERCGSAIARTGSAIAKVFVDRGYQTTVWNRTASRCDPIVEAGATAAATAAEAVAASPLAVVCVLDSAAVDQVLGSIDSAVAGKVLVNLTSGTPAQGRANERWARERAEYLDGKIMGDPPCVGTPNILFPFGGSPRAFEAHEPTSQVLGGVTYQCEDAGAAAVEFMAQVAVGYEFFIGFLYVLTLVQAEGVDVAGFAERVAGSLSG